MEGHAPHTAEAAAAQLLGGLAGISSSKETGEI